MTAGYPTVADTVPILLSMQEGGADIIELGVPFSDPIADGPTIQETNVVSQLVHADRSWVRELSSSIDRIEEQHRLRAMSGIYQRSA